jgi:Spy/CpxP family protein refolding chaperone
MSGGAARVAVIVLACVLVASGAALAQRAVPAERAARILEALLIWRLVDDLNLTDAQIARIFPQIRALKNARLEFARRQRELREEIRGLLRQRPRNPELIEVKVAELQTVKTQFEQRRAAILQRIQAALSVEQQARFVLIQETFEEDTVRLLNDLQRFIEQNQRQ